MTVRKFAGKDSRSVMQQIRNEMGPDAMILSNRTVKGGIEFLVLTQEDVDLLASAASIDSMPPPLAKSGTAQPTPGQNSHGTDMMEVIGEIRSMRAMLETQIVDIAWGASQQQDPRKVAILRETLDAGFSPALARRLAEQFPATEKCTASVALNWVKSVLAGILPCQGDDSELLAEGGVFALVGPTGVGKTTTTAKLAARFVMQHGPGKLALITTDNYRIAGHEQLRTYGRLLGVMVHTVMDEVEMRIALGELKNKHMILIDTVGMSQRDKRVESQIAMLRNSSIKRLLCISAISQMGTLEEVALAYGDGLTGVIITKLDEAVTLGGVMDVIIRKKFPLYYIANGQRVPEDLLVPDGPKLIDMVFSEKKLARQFQVEESELALLMPHAKYAPLPIQGHAS
ncbi:MAG: flagellar biosynthesis protein FlhF [Proteobacteria bacterium]|nr:flagellar biosynthesis protein FlhF [Pseudomonadota bacterium]